MTWTRSELMERAKDLAVRIASHSPTAVRVRKAILDRIEKEGLRRGYEIERAGTVRMSGHSDSKEALVAFREKRPPVYAPRSHEQVWFGK